ncbi:hypothetical protein ACFUEJ_21455 [Gordonia sp. NPDC057258]|uniref:hypothetical protein n=1 Tax=unclassified Gordonia (in: high G+C Gram-positive bacteria) TaxID=2657482 RepID=UPI001CFA8796|nr:hypothetical protein [Gordonia sp. WA4-43]UCZ90713.1 hypothetical protein LEL84_03230 [Gordonia sp. WA4-43]
MIAPSAENLDFVLADTPTPFSGYVPGKTVLLHCVAGHQRTSSVAIEYDVTLGHPLAQVSGSVGRSPIAGPGSSRASFF